MKTVKRITIMLAAAVIFITAARGQGFLNLNFESANNLTNPPASGVFVPTANGLPGWAATNGDVALTYIYYVSNYIDGGSSVVLEGGSLALSGDFSVSFDLGGSISQKGLVPANAQSLEFDAYIPGPTSDFWVTLGGERLSYSALSEGSDYTVYGANIPAGLDGQVEALMFLCQDVADEGTVLDNIEFSTMSVPEPSECALICLGAVLFGIRYRRRQMMN